MLKHWLVLILLSISIYSCAQNSNNTTEQKSSDPEETRAVVKKSIIDTSGYTIASRFNAPESFARIEATNNSFAAYLRQLPLKATGSYVKYYNGDIKYSNTVYAAVVDLPIGKRNLHQCADAVMRLRAEYLYQQKAYDQIHFNFTNGFKADYANWASGKRIVVNGNNVYWTNSGSPSYSYKTFWKYLEMVFAYAGTLSLDKELHTIQPDNIQIGDVFIQGGSPGHAIIVVDIAINNNGNKKILLAQSYMPAQEIQVLYNPSNPKSDPWYDWPQEVLVTPEWTFSPNDLKRF